MSSSPPSPAMSAATHCPISCRSTSRGKIAMKLAPDDGIIGVATCTEQDDFLLTTRAGKCIRFPVGDVRVFKGRDSTGVRGIKLAETATKWSACRCSIIPTPAAPKRVPI